MSPASIPGAEPPALRYRLRLHPGRERALVRRHPWVFSGAVEVVEALPDAVPGDLGTIHGADGALLGTAIVNPQMPLVARMLRFGPGAIDSAWLRGRLETALRLREERRPDRTNAYRLINAEGDGLPGWIVDRYGDWLVVQCLTAGMSRLQSLWLPALAERVAPRGILERSARATREAGLAGRDGLLWGEAPPPRLVIEEYGHRFIVDPASGQKTGFYLDQRENRRLLAPFAAGKNVLDACAYTGAFSVWMGAAGARRVVAVETSAAALELLAANWELNGLAREGLEIVHDQVGRFLRRDERRYDLIVLDPPPLARGRGDLVAAARAQKDLALWALRRLAPGGLLAAFSCSQRVDAPLFQKILFGASLDAGVPVQWLSRLGAGADHPVHLDHPEGEYLRGLLMRSLAEA